MISKAIQLKKSTLVLVTASILFALVISAYAGWVVRGSAGSGAGSTTSASLSEQPPAPLGSAALFGTISNIKKDKDAYSLDLRLAEAVSGSDWWEQNAIEDGRCTLEMVEQNNCAAYFYIRTTQKILHIAVDKEVAVALINRVDTSKFESITMSELEKEFSKSDYSTTPFHVTTTQGVITKIQEQYVP